MKRRYLTLRPLSLALLMLVQCASSPDAPSHGRADAAGASSSAGGASGSSAQAAAGGLAPGIGGGNTSGSAGSAGASSVGLGGSNAGSAGSGTSSGAATGSNGGGANATGGGAGAGAACAGIPIVPDAGGFVAPASNSLGIHGSWFVYSDCPDQKGLPCSTVKSPPANTFPNMGGKMCTSGSTSSAAGAWGAGIALELNDKPPQQPYDTTAHGIKGFCLVLSGTTLPSTGIRVAFPTQNVPDDVYFETVSTPGAHTVLFTNTAQGSWVTKKVAFEPTRVMLLQLQIPSSPTAPVNWDFCVEGLTAITQ